MALALGRPVHAEATCPATGTSITVDITPEGVERIDPLTAVVAVVDLDADLTLGLDRIDADVCAQQPFFASAQAASRWLADHPQRSAHSGAVLPRRSPPPRRPAGGHTASHPNAVNAADGDHTMGGWRRPIAGTDPNPPLPQPDGPLDPTVSASPIEEVRPGRFNLLELGGVTVVGRRLRDVDVG